MKKPSVGQTLYALNINNTARHRPQELQPVKVLSVGRKYFKALSDLYANSPHMAIECMLEDWRERTDYTPRWKLYESEQQWKDEQERDRLNNDIRNLFRSCGNQELPLSALRIAHAALFPRGAP